MPVNNIQQTVDPTGILSQLDMHEQDISNIIDQFNQLQDQLNGGNITQNQQNIIVFDNTTNRVLIGYQQVLQQWGMFVSQPGIDVTTATAAQLIFNSQQDVFKVVQSGILVPSSDFTTSDPGTGKWGSDSTTLVQVAHNLDFTPSLQSFILGGGGAYGIMPVQTFFSPISSEAHWYTFSTFVDSAFVYLELSTMDFNAPQTVAASALQFKYYLFQESFTN